MWGDQRGQTVTEYLMIGGLIIAVALVVYPTVRPQLIREFERIATCVLNDGCP
jgi:Flp pilus assembly pilin Flp